MFDPIVDAIRSTRERLAMVDGGDVYFIAKAARKRQELAGTKTATRPARRPEPSRISPSQPSGGPSVSPKDNSSPTAL